MFGKPLFQTGISTESSTKSTAPSFGSLAAAASAAAAVPVFGSKSQPATFGSFFGSFSGAGTGFGSSSEAGTGFGASGTGTGFGTSSGTGTGFGSSSGTGTGFGSSVTGTGFGSSSGTGTIFGSLTTGVQPERQTLASANLLETNESSGKSAVLKSTFLSRSNFGGQALKPLVVDTSAKMTGARLKTKSPEKFTFGGLFPGAAKRRSSSSSTSKLDSSQLQLCTTIKLQNVPHEINDKSKLMRHFGQFGAITKISVRPKGETALIEFTDHDSAKKAKEAPFDLITDSQVKVHYVLPSSLINSVISPVGSTARSTATSKISQARQPFRHVRFLVPSPTQPKNAFQKSAGSKHEKTTDKSIVSTSAENTKALVSQLKSLIGVQAISTRDKWQLLEQRDKIIRKYTSKVSDVNKAAFFRGTCPDMCPEKERYRREVQILLHAYEIDPDTSSVDHVRAVKDYARSSADQEEPLPHELRSSDILQKTMHYLISQIITNEPGDPAQLPIWYDFLWNRTRAIRKDITQQMLSDSSAIDLIEKCARLHIYAAYLLCEADIGAFDQRMNTENLQKCLLSLRHMYDDSNKSGLNCPNEPEFRCYDLLLNLNDSNIFRQALIYKQSVRQSDQIKFALKLCSVMQNNNYVSFFRLIRQKATFLQSCLIHRYFNQVRSDAIKTMVKSYGAASQLPLSGLTSLLHFDAEDEAASFFAHFGLPCAPNAPPFGSTTSTDCVLLNKAVFVEPETPPLTRHSSILVDSKRTASAPELINGSPIQSFCFIDPVISFDADHRYKRDKVIEKFLDSAESQSEPCLFDQVDDSSELHFETIRQRQNEEHASIQEKLATDMADRLLDALAVDLIKIVLKETKEQKLAEYYFFRLVSDSLREIIEENYADAKRQRVELEHKKQAILALIQKLASKFGDDIIETTCFDYSREIAEKEHRLASEKWLASAHRHVDRLSLDICQNIVDRCVASELRDVCKQIFETRVGRVLFGLQRIRQNLNALNARKCFDHWLRLTKRRKKVRKILGDFPLPSGRMTERNFAVPAKRIRLTLPSLSAIFSGNKPTRNDACIGSETNSLSDQRLEPQMARVSLNELDQLLLNLKRGIKTEKSLIEQDLSESPI